jgi:DNA-directed RNA polymerase subunit M/transcription elongation factor TFIIS
MPKQLKNILGGTNKSMAINSRDIYMKKCEQLNSVIDFNDNKVIEKLYINLNKFKTTSSNDIKYDLILIAENTINRSDAREQIKKFVKYDFISFELEKGLYEFSLVKTTIENLQNHYVTMIYNDQLNNICENLDVNNKSVNNQTLILTLTQQSFDPYYVPFLSPEQLHPKRWIDVTLKKQIRDEAQNSFQTTDMYKCKKCHERKFKITEIQLRSSDEPCNRVCLCMTCFYTFIL